MVEHDAGVHLGADSKSDAARDVGFDKAGDDFDFWTLGGEHKMDTGGAAFLGDADDKHLEVLPCHHHEVGHLVNNNDNVWHLAFFFGILGGGFGHFGVVIGDVFDFFFGH